MDSVAILVAVPLTPVMAAGHRGPVVFGNGPGHISVAVPFILTLKVVAMKVMAMNGRVNTYSPI